MKLTEHFSLQEFQSRDMSSFPDYVIENLKELADNLEVLREHFGKPIIITSGYRSIAHNARVGGAINGYHPKGMAGDIKIPGIKPQIIYNAIELLIKYGKMKEGGLGLYRSWVHYDIRGTKARWKN